jgi:O-antigen/teichoic acid export membrane protein
MSGKLTRSVVNGASWSGVSQILGQGLRFISFAVLARILSPSDFGLLAMVGIVTSIAGNLIDIGFIEVIVQRKEITQRHLTTVFWSIVGAGLLLSLLVIAISPLVSRFFNNSQVGPLLAVSSSIFIIQSTGAVHSALLRRKLLFFRASMADIGDAVGYMAGALTAAHFGLGVWSLVIGNITGCIPGVTIRWILSGWRPSFFFYASSLKDLWKFSLNNIGMRMVGIINGQIDSFIIGKFLLPSVLGFYTLASRIASFPSGGIGAIGNRVALPALAMVQDEPKRLQRGVLKGESFLSIIGVPLFAGIAVVAPELVRVYAGPQWMPSVLPLRILCLAGCVSILNIGIPALFLAKGRPDIDLKLNLIQTGFLIPALLIGVRFDLLGASIGVTTATVAAWLLRQLFVHQVIKLSFREYLLSLLPAFISSLIMAAAVLTLRYVLTRLFDLPDIPLLVLDVVVGTGVYLSVLKLGKNQAFEEITTLLLEMIRPLGKGSIIKSKN